MHAIIEAWTSCNGSIERVINLTGDKASGQAPDRRYHVSNGGDGRGGSRTVCKAQICGQMGKDIEWWKAWSKGVN